MLKLGRAVAFGKWAVEFGERAVWLANRPSATQKSLSSTSARKKKVFAVWEALLKLSRSSGIQGALQG